MPQPLTLQKSQRNLYGKALAFPLAVDGRGRLDTVEGLACIEQSISVILGTYLGETLFYRDMGGEIPAMVHGDMQRVVSQGPGQAKKAIMLHEPRVKSCAVTATADELNHAVRLEISYVAIGYAIAQNMTLTVRMSS